MIKRISTTFTRRPAGIVAARILSTVSLGGMMTLAAPTFQPSTSATLQFQSGHTQTSLVELYTSEGCSSCPPAEAWLSRLTTADGLWKRFVPLAFHVNYWDYLGWKDPWGDRRFTDRQRVFAETWKADNIYTPEFVLNGLEWQNWQRVNTPPPASHKAGQLTVASTNGIDWEVSFAPETPQDGFEIHGAFLAGGMSSDVKAGENRGRQLIHDFVVVTLASQTLDEEFGSFLGRLKVDYPKRYLKGRKAIAFWVTGKGQNRPLQATGGWLP